jgi:hypothetical protein
MKWAKAYKKIVATKQNKRRVLTAVKSKDTKMEKIRNTSPYELK